ncbi:MAG: trimethylamine methyltransferase family protein [Anaerolineae bacterium]|jgi:trimethylamine--corrinoid protein Co-methyltransferase
MLDEIHQVGPGGHFLDTAQTLSRFRDFWYPGLLDRSVRPNWLNKGASTLGERLTAKVKSILAEYETSPLDDGVKTQIQAIVAQSGS